eukprot:3421244-Rhodomonas_salina.2
MELGGRERGCGYSPSVPGYQGSGAAGLRYVKFAELGVLSLAPFVSFRPRVHLLLQELPGYNCNGDVRLCHGTSPMMMQYFREIPEAENSDRGPGPPAGVKTRTLFSPRARPSVAP